MTPETITDRTLDPALLSWVDSANDEATDFPVQNLPLGVFRRSGSEEAPRLGVAIGDQVLDLRACSEAGLLGGLDPHVVAAVRATSLNDLMALGRGASVMVRRAASDLLRADEATLRDDPALREKVLAPQASAEMCLPATIGDYTDFYASVHHATNVGSMFRPDNPLLPNYRHLPVGYHGRASTIVVSGTPVRRPCGQTRPDDAAPPVFGPCRLLDYEMELGFYAGPANATGTRVTMGEAPDHIFGMCIVNDWSARDVQKWEYQPLGPFNAKNFATTVSPWVVTMEALEPFRLPGPPREADDPPTLDYLRPIDDITLDITVEVLLRSAAMREQGTDPVRLSRGSFRHMYWTIAQMLVHHTSTGCGLRPGDLLASGTVSGPEKGSRGCLLELTWRGAEPIELPDGTTRKFLQDGDEVIMRAHCEREGAARIGFGECTGVVLPAE